MRPADTGRSTNCLINDLGIYVHQQERGFHNYALPYSWDVRLGHKTRDAALAELDDEIDPERMRRLLSDIGYSEARIATADAPAALAAFYVAVDTLTDDEVRRQLLERCPALSGSDASPAGLVHPADDQRQGRRSGADAGGAGTRRDAAAVRGT